MKGNDSTQPYVREDDALPTASRERAPAEPTPTPRGDPPPGTQVGRYVVEDVIGRGGMGIVVRARDPTLERPVAIKLVHGRPDPQRLLREARALARLDHESIIAVYDAGPYEGGVFIAMECFEGVPMQQWLAGRRPGVDELVGLFLRLADALRSAHAMGLVHRDVKPQNVLIDPETGSIRVVDFGLARSYESVELDELPAGGDHGRPRLGPITRHDWVIGTPPYMAPELLTGGPPSREGDTWSLGVTLFEALHGRRPFEGATLRDQLLEMRRPPAMASHVPRALRRLLRRMLEPDPARRSTLSQVHTALHRFAHRKRRRRVGLGVAVLVGGSVAAGAMAFGGGAECSSDASAAEELWSEATSTEIEAAFAHAASYGEEAWARLRPAVDERFTAWEWARGRACGGLPGTEDPTQRQRVLECLDRHLGALEAAVATLRQPTPTLAARTDELIDRLPDPYECTDRSALEWLAPVPEQASRRQEAVRIRAALNELWLLRIAGRLDEARRSANALHGDATALGDAPVAAEVALERGRVLAELDRHQPAEASFREALRLGLRPDYLQIRAEAALALAEELGHGQKRFAEAREALLTAEALVTTRGDPALRDRLRLIRGRVLLAAEDFVGARAAYEELLQEGGATLARGDLLHDLASTLVVDDRPQALELLEQALRLRIDDYGPSHPRVADTLLAMGRISLYLWELDAGEQALQRARRIRVELFGEESTAVAEIDAALGGAAVRSGDLDAARRLLESALAVLGSDPDGVEFDTTATRSTLGTVYARQGRFEDALREHRATMELVSTTAGPNHRRMALPLLNLASTYRRMGKLADAIDWQRKAIAANAITHQRAELEIELAEMLRLVGRPSEARAILAGICHDGMPSRVCSLARIGLAELDLDEGRGVVLEPDAEEVRRSYGHSPSQLARLLLVEARAAWQAGRPTEAHEHAHAALEQLGVGVDVADYDQRRVRSWLESHPLP